MDKEFAVEALGLAFVGAAWVAATSPIQKQVVKIEPTGGVEILFEADFSMFSQCVTIEALENVCVPTNVGKMKNDTEGDSYIVAAFASRPTNLTWSATAHPPITRDGVEYDLITPGWRAVVFATLFVAGVSFWITGATIRSQAPTYKFLGRRAFAWLFFIGLVFIALSIIVHVSLIQPRNHVAKGNIAGVAKDAKAVESGTGRTALFALLAIGLLVTFIEVET